MRFWVPPWVGKVKNGAEPEHPKYETYAARPLAGVKRSVGDKCLGMLEAVGEVFPEAKYQRCTVHFYCNVFSVTPRSKVKLVAKMLKAIHAQESKKAAREKAKADIVNIS